MIEKVGKYRIIREAGKGATATVYMAEDSETGATVAIKLVQFAHSEEGRWNRRIRKLFQGEGNVARMLDHPNIVRVFETVIADDQAYIVMEFLDGKPLDQFIAFDKLLPVHRVVGVIFKCCLALDYAFHQGIVHRDIKPANILVDDQDNVKIMDFGLALNLGKKSETDSTFIMGVGSPAYMSPEQIKGYPLNQKTDIYSLGVVLFQLLSGRLPFRAKNPAQLVYKIINADAPPVSNLNPDIPVAMDRIIQKALEKDLYSRYKNGAEMAKDLSAVRYQILDDNYVPMDTRRFDVLRKLGFFVEFDDIEIWEVLRISQWREVEPDAVLLREGEEGTSFGIVVDGEVEISLSGKRLGLIRAGESVGETAYLNPAVPHRSTSVVAVTPVTYLEVNPSALALATEECQEHFRQVLVATVVRRLALANESLAIHAEAGRQVAGIEKLELELEPLDEAWKRG